MSQTSIARIHETLHSVHAGADIIISQFYPWLFKLLKFEESSKEKLKLIKIDSNIIAWDLQNKEQLFPSQEVILDHFHIFEWFPLNPGLYHRPYADESRKRAVMHEKKDQDGTYFYPEGKLLMIQGGIGAIRLKSLPIENQNYYLMTASSNGVCEAGFPILLPEKLYIEVKTAINMRGILPATVHGKMISLPELPDIFEYQRRINRWILQVDDLKMLPACRSDVGNLSVSVAVAYLSVRPNDHYEPYQVNITYSTFDPQEPEGIANAVRWIKDVYLKTKFKGEILTDFDEINPRFPNVKFGLADIMQGKLSLVQAKEIFQRVGYDKLNIFINYYDQRILIGDISNSRDIAIGHNKTTPE